MANLGKLNEIKDIRTLWPHEQYDFSKWLASEDIIKELGDTLGLSLIDVKLEESTGKYRCDITCKEETTDKVVIIENQLEASNHDHLGKIITYASGFNAAIVIWIVKKAEEEHSCAINWLNEHTDDEISFFLLEIHAYTIGNSEPAPRFEIIEKPNNFQRNSKLVLQSNDLNKSQSHRLQFWTQFEEILDARDISFGKKKASIHADYYIPLGKTGYSITITLLSVDHRIRLGLTIWDNKEIYQKISKNKDKIEEKYKKNLEWNCSEENKKTSICEYIAGLDFDDQSNYEDLMNKIIEEINIFKEIFSEYV